MAKLPATDLQLAEGWAREIVKAYRKLPHERRSEAAEELRDIARRHPYGSVLNRAADELDS